MTLDTQKFLKTEPSQIHKSSNPSKPSPTKLDDEDFLDWDAKIETAPPRPRGTIRVRLKYGGRSKPIPLETPWVE